MRPLKQLFGLAKMDPLPEDVKIYVPTPEEFNRMVKEREAFWTAFYARYAPRQ